VLRCTANKYEKHNTQYYLQLAVDCMGHKLIYIASSLSPYFALDLLIYFILF